MARSIMMNLGVKKCWLCGAEGVVEQHHCMHGTANRKKADEDGLIINLCIRCHRRLHDKGECDGQVKSEAQIRWMDYNMATEEEWLARYGRSYL